MTDSARIVDVLAEKELLHPYLFVREARGRGWHEEDDFVAWRDHSYAGLLLEHLMQAEVKDRLSITEDDLRAYYDDHREEFHVGATASIEEVHVKDEPTARQLRDDIIGGISFAEILLRTGVASYGKHRLGGRISVQSHFAQRFPELVEAALAAEVGKLVGPVYLEEAERYAVLRVIERQESRIRPFDEARKSVRHALGVEQSNMLVSSLFQSVREKYEDRVVIFDDLLEQRHSNQ